MKDEAGEVEEEGLLFDDGSLTGEAFDHTGLKRTWPAARCLARYLVSHPEEVQHKAILELGAAPESRRFVRASSEQAASY